jgi:hypothetical protein
MAGPTEDYEMTSAAHIIIAKPVANPDPMKRLQRLLDTIRPGTNRHEQATVMIEACIGEGFDTRPRIIGALRQLGFDPRHIAITLKGDNPYGGRWLRSAGGIYSLTA